MKKSAQPLTIYQEINRNTKPALIEQQLIRLLSATPKRHIYQRPAKGGGQWDYVKGSYVEKVLNYVFGWNWDFEIKSKEEKYGQIVVEGRLTVRTKNATIVKEQFGRADIKFKKNTTTPLDYGNDLKAAATDSLKKCASKLGIASDVYAKEEFREIKLEQEPQKIENAEEPATENQIQTIKSMLPEDKRAEVDSWNMTKQEAADKIRELGAKKE